MTTLEHIARAMMGEAWPFERRPWSEQSYALDQAKIAVTTLRDTLSDPVVKAALSSVLEEGA